LHGSAPGEKQKYLNVQVFGVAKHDVAKYEVAKFEVAKNESYYSRQF
jgi:uncharacterized secreted protein with C-terminal beta-propeller domain